MDDGLISTSLKGCGIGVVKFMADTRQIERDQRMEVGTVGVSERWKWDGKPGMGSGVVLRSAAQPNFRIRLDLKMLS
jgi:hypothetical protein